MTAQQYAKWLNEYNSGLRPDPPPLNWQIGEYSSPVKPIQNLPSTTPTSTSKGTSSNFNFDMDGLRNIIRGAFGGKDSRLTSITDPGTLGVNALFNDPNDYYSKAISRIDASGNSWWNTLSNSAKQDLINLYKGDEIKDWSTLWGVLPGAEYAPDIDGLLADLEELSAVGDFDLEMPSYESIEEEIAKQLKPEYERARQRELDSFNAKNTALDEAQALTQKSYEDQLQNMSSMYNRQASTLMSNQYLANAQTFDTLQSDMRKSRQNALEAGASAGVRIAGNVNALLSAQNKQSATAMDTSNALAEMLLQQRNAASGLRSDYNQYMSQYKSNKANAKADYNTALTNADTAYRSELSDAVDTRYGREMSDYNKKETDYNSKFDRLTGNKLVSAYRNAIS